MRQRLASPGVELAEEAAPYDLQFPGPAHLPFDHDDVRVYVDNLFTDGLLAPAGGISRALVAGSWMAVGVAGSEGADQAARFRKLLQLLQSERPSSSSDHQAWIQAATRWAEVVALRWSLPEDLPPEDNGPFRWGAPTDRADTSKNGWLRITARCTVCRTYRGRSCCIRYRGTWRIGLRRRGRRGSWPWLSSTALPWTSGLLSARNCRHENGSPRNSGYSPGCRR